VPIGGLRTLPISGVVVKRDRNRNRDGLESVESS
jgi:hypothetical protein